MGTTLPGILYRRGRTWIPKGPGPTGGGGALGGGGGGTTNTPSVIQETLAGADAVIPIIYGSARVGGQIFVVTADSSKRLIIGVVWCVGEVQSIAVEINDETVDDASPIDITTYKGLPSQGIDPTLAAAIQGYNDTLVYNDPTYGNLGIAYSVIRVPPDTEGVTGFPRITARIEGRKVYCCVASGYVYSRNPALILADLIRDPIIGMRRPVNLASQTATQTFCNEIISGSHKRRELDLVLSDAQDIVQVLETVRQYAGCFLYFGGEEAFLVPNAPLPADYDPAVVTASHIIKGSMQVSRGASLPNVVTVSYTDITAEPWRTHYARVVSPSVASGGSPWREESISMPGIVRYGQAYREAEERLNAYRYCSTNIEFVMTNEGLSITPGDVISVTHPTGFTSALFRVLAIDSSSPGRWRVKARNYDVREYSNSNPTTPPFPNIKPPTSDDDPITGKLIDLTLTEIFSVDTGGMPISKINATWTEVDHANLAKYEVNWKRVGDSGYASEYSQANTWTSSAVIKAVTYAVRVRTVATDGAVGAWSDEETIQIQGKTSNIWQPPQIPGGRFGPGYVEFAWTFPAGATDIAYTEVYVSAVSGTVLSNLAAKVSYPISSFIYRGPTGAGIPPNTCYYFLGKFVDTSGIASVAFPSSGGVPAPKQICTPLSTDGSVDDLLKYYTGEIRDSHLYEELRTKIDTAATNGAYSVTEVTKILNGGEDGALWAIKIAGDLPQRVAGIGLYNGEDEGSQFLVQADRFAVYAQPPVGGALEVVPFVVDTVNNRVVMSDVFIESAVIDDAAITNAKIENLAVGTTKIDHNAVSVAAVSSTQSSYSFSSLGYTTRTYSNIVSGLDPDRAYAGLIVVVFDAYVGKNSQVTSAEGNLQPECWDPLGRSTPVPGSLGLVISVSGKFATTIDFPEVAAIGSLPVSIVRPYSFQPTAGGAALSMTLTFTGRPAYCQISGGADYVEENTTISTILAGIYLWKK